MNAKRKPLTKPQQELLRRIRRDGMGPLHETSVVVDPECFEVLSELQKEDMAVIKERVEELEGEARCRVWLTPKGWARGA